MDEKYPLWMMILCNLQEGDNFTRLRKRLGTDIATMSKHLRFLEKRGLVSFSKEGREKKVSLTVRGSLVSLALLMVQQEVALHG